MAEKKKSAPVSTGPVKPEDKKKALETALAQIEKNFGKGAIMRLGDDIPVNVEAISTGSLSLDLALGIGGVPRGRIVEIYGPESSGKTTLALHILASAQKEGGEVAFIDVEHALEPAYARALGVDIDSLLISQPDTGEQALEITEQLVRSGALDVVVVDSVAALLPRSELEGEMGESSVGVIARLMSQALRKLAGTVSRTNCIVVFINQLREKIGVMYGNPETTPGGRALKYFSSVRIDVRRIETLKVGGEMIGNRTRAKIVKNKVAPPFKEAEFDIIYGEGISKIGEIVDLGVKLDLIDKAGAWYTYGDVRVQGRDSMKEYLREHPDVSDKIEAEIRANAHKLMSPQARKAAIASGRVGKYVTDFPNEKVVGVDNIIALPHLGACTPESEEKSAVMAARELYDYLANGNIKNSVNFPDATLERMGVSRVCILHQNVPTMLNQFLEITCSTGLNVENMINKAYGAYAYAMIDLNGRLDDDQVAKIDRIPEVIRVRVV